MILPRPTVINVGYRRDTNGSNDFEGIRHEIIGHSVMHSEFGRVYKLDP